MDAKELLEQSPLFTCLSAQGRDRARLAFAPRRFERDEPVYLRGSEAHAFYGVMQGRVRFSAGSNDGKEVLLDYMTPGQWFGEIGLFDSGPRVVDAVAAEPTHLLVLARRDLLELCRQETDLLFRVVELFSQRIRMAEQIILETSFHTVPTRLARRLLLLAIDESCTEETARGPAIRISQEELGRLIGVTRESAGKQLKIWERERVLELDYGRVIVVDAGRLRRIVAAANGD